MELLLLSFSLASFISRTTKNYICSIALIFLSGTKCPVSGTNQLVPDTLSGAVENLFSGLPWKPVPPSLLMLPTALITGTVPTLAKTVQH